MADNFPSHGITEQTPKSLVLGAGTIHAGLTYTEGTGWNAAETIIAATSGGNKLTIAPEITDVEIDGMFVAVEGMAFKTGETATLEVNMAEFNEKTLKLATLSTSKDAEAEGYVEITSKPTIEAGDYIENFGFVGKTVEGKPVIVIFDKALCTSGLEWDAKAKEVGVLPATFKCYGSITGDLQASPWHIYFPKSEATGA